MSSLQDIEAQLQQRLGGTVIGMQELIRALIIAIVSRGHVLVQGPPGLGKTLLGKTPLPRSVDDLPGCRVLRT